MGLFNFNKDGKGVAKTEKEAPAIVLFFSRYFRNFWRIVCLNLLYIFACAPIITIGPATAGLTYVLRNYGRARPVDMFSDFFAKAKEHFWKSLLISVLDLLFAVIAVESYFLWTDPDFTFPQMLRTIGIVVVIVISIFYVCTNFYLFPMLVSFDLPLKKVIRNSIILGMYKWGPNLLMLIFNAAVIAACIMLWPSSLSVIILLPFSTCCFFNNFVVFPVLMKHVAIPEEKPEDIKEDEAVFSDTLQ